MSEKELEQVMAALDGSGSQRIGYKAQQGQVSLLSRFLRVILIRPRRHMVEPFKFKAALLGPMLPRAVYSLQLPMRKRAVRMREKL